VLLNKELAGLILWGLEPYLILKTAVETDETLEKRYSTVGYERLEAHPFGTAPQTSKSA
jgi:hypothetical protein